MKINNKYKMIVKNFIDTFYEKETVFYDEDTGAWYSRLTGNYEGYDYIKELCLEIQEHYVSLEEEANNFDLGQANS